MKTPQNSNSEQVLTTGAGGLSGQTPQPPPLQSLAQADTPEQLLASLPQAGLPDCTIVGDPPSKSGKKPVLTEQNGSDIPNSTLVGTANWALKMLQRRGLIRFGLSANGKNYRVLFSTSAWMFENGVLTLRDVPNSTDDIL